MRVSVDTFDPEEIRTAVGAGAELVLSVNGSNIDVARDSRRAPGARRRRARARRHARHAGADARQAGEAWARRYLIDPILEPIGHGLHGVARALRRSAPAYPEAEMLMGIGNLTELTAADSTGVQRAAHRGLPGAGHPHGADHGSHSVGARRGARSGRRAAADALRRHAAHHPEGRGRPARDGQGPGRAGLLGRRAARAAGRHHRSELPHLRRPRGDHRANNERFVRGTDISATSSRSSASTSRRTRSTWARSSPKPASPSRSARPTGRKARSRGAISRRPTDATPNTSG